MIKEKAKKSYDKKNKCWIFTNKIKHKKTKNIFLRFFKRLYSCYFILIAKDAFNIHTNSHNPFWRDYDKMEIKIYMKKEGKK
jgi:hypothetical protein